MPAIVHLNHGHFVVLFHLTPEGVYLGDPASGLVTVSFDHFAERSILLHNLSILYADLIGGIVDRLDDFFADIGVNIAGVEVHGDTDFLFAVTVVAAVSSCQSLLNGFLDGFFGEILFLGDCFNG